jgi:hypothetical protein
LRLEGHWRKEQGPELDPDPLVRVADPDPYPMSRIQKTGRFRAPHHSFEIRILKECSFRISGWKNTYGTSTEQDNFLPVTLCTVIVCLGICSSKGPALTISMPFCEFSYSCTTKYYKWFQILKYRWTPSLSCDSQHLSSGQKHFRYIFRGFALKLTSTIVAHISKN